MKRYKILFDYGSAGYQLHDEGFSDVKSAVKCAIGLNYAIPFLIITVIDWEAAQKCPYPDCPKVRYYNCPVHGLDAKPE